MIRRPPRATLTYTLLPYTTLCLSLVCTTIPASATGRERPRHRSKLTPRGIRAVHPPGGSVVRPHVVLSSQTGIDHAQSPARPPDALVRQAELSQAVPADRRPVRRRCHRAGHDSLPRRAAARSCQYAAGQLEQGPSTARVNIRGRVRPPGWTTY